MNLRHKRYYILNKPHSREEYFARVAELKKLPREKLFEMLEELKLQEPHIYFQGYNNENAIGDHIFWSKNAYACFDVNGLEDCFYMTNAYQCRDCCDVNYTSLSELNYFCHSAVNLYNSNFCSVCWYSQGLEYCEYVFNSHDCFGCVSLNHAAYCILNVKYEPEEYARRVAAIKDEMKRDGSYGGYLEALYQQ